MTKPGPYRRVEISEAYGKSALLVIDFLFDGFGPAAGMHRAGLTPNIDWPRGTREFLDALFADPKLYTIIRRRHLRGERFDALAGSYLDEFEWENTLPWSIPEWHEDEIADIHRDLAKATFAGKHGARYD